MASDILDRRESPEEEPATKPRIQTAARTVAVLQEIASSEQGLRAKDIWERLQLPRQVTYHLIQTLMTIGALRKNEQNRYVLGLGMASIAEGFRRQLAPPEHLAPLVRAAVGGTGETAYASGWLEGRIAVLATRRGNSPVQAAEVPHGYSAHAHARASGKLLLALADEATRSNYLERNPLVPLTGRTITDPARLAEEMRLTRERGYALDIEEFSLGLCCLAVPVENLGQHYALGISVPSERFAGRLDDYLEQLRKAARFGAGLS